MTMPGRKFIASPPVGGAGGGYRYGFNGKENDKDVSEGIQDYGMRIYDARIAKFLSIDPITSEYPELTPYQFASDRPIDGIDIDGLEWGEYGGFAWAQSDAAYRAIAKEKGVSKKEIEKFSKTQFKVSGATQALAGLIALDIFFTGGQVSKTALSIYTYSQLAGAFEHNKGKTPQEREAQNKRGKEALTNAIIGYGFSKVTGVLTKIAVGGGQYIYKTFKATSIRFSQSSVNGLEPVVSSMSKKGWQGDPIDIVKMKDGYYTSADNTRLFAAQIAGVEVKAVAHNYTDEISEKIASRFLGKDGSIPKTWGEAIENRIKSQNREFRTNYENGSFVKPKIGVGN